MMVLQMILQIIFIDGMFDFPDNDNDKNYNNY